MLQETESILPYEDGLVRIQRGLWDIEYFHGQCIVTGCVRCDADVLCIFTPEIQVAQSHISCNKLDGHRVTSLRPHQELFIPKVSPAQQGKMPSCVPQTSSMRSP